MVTAIDIVSTREPNGAKQDIGDTIAIKVTQRVGGNTRHCLVSADEARRHAIVAIGHANRAFDGEVRIEQRNEARAQIVIRQCTSMKMS